MAVYTWKTGARPNCSAQTAGEVCAELEKRGALTPQNLVDVSRQEGAPLHGAFEWDDAAAAEKYRESQAAYIIRSIEVEIDGAAEPTKAFVSLSIDGTHREYIGIEAAMRTEDTRELLLDQAKRDMESFRSKYRQLEELADVFAAISKLVA